jgi:glycosyltransferase involved in cell wall biosynthesis
MSILLETDRLIVALQQPIIADYRMGLFRLLRNKWGSRFQVFAGDADFGGSPESTIEAWGYFQHIENHYLLGERFLWQYGCFRQLLAADVTILNGNMRMLSNNVILVLRKFLGRRTILWGHAEGQSGVAAAIRRFYLWFCDGFIAYTESQAELLRKRYPKLKVWVAANSCVSAADCVPVEAELGEVDSILYVGRLVKKKKVRLLLEGYRYAREQGLLPETVRLVFVGDGVERSRLESRVRELGLTESVRFAGHVSDVAQLREYYRRAMCSVSPGYVGLSATQSFSFGVPMLIARDEFHSPEIEACKEGFNATFFASDDEVDLAKQLAEIWRLRADALLERGAISKWTEGHYSFEVMRDAMVSAVEGV